MAKEYFEKLSALLDEIEFGDHLDTAFTVKHFFSGAALYVDERICVTWRPVGLAFKLSAHEVDNLVNDGCAKTLRYFPKGPIKRHYALFENPENRQASHWIPFFLRVAQQP